MTWKSLPDITPNGVASTLSEVNNSPNASTIIEAEAVLITAIGSGNSIRFGDSAAAATQGVLLPQNVPVLFPPLPPYMGKYLLHQMWVFGTSTDKVSIAYAV